MRPFPPSLPLGFASLTAEWNLLGRAIMATDDERKTALEKPQVDRIVEVAAAILLAAATVASAWCAYQAERWSGVQVFRLNESDIADRRAVELSLRASQARMVDAIMFMRFMTAMVRDDKHLQQFYLASFRPEMRKAVDVWLASRQTNNPVASPHPLALPEYRLSVDEQAQEAMRTMMQLNMAATEAKHASDQYVLLTVLLASVLFFGGIATHFVASQIKIAVFALGMLAFLATLFWLSKCPMAP